MSPISPQNLLRHEVIGLNVRIASATNRQLTGLAGKVVDETKNTLTVFDGTKRRIVPKDTALFHFYLPTGEIVGVNGKRLVGRSEDRVKMRVRKW
jgi:ribonuclease P protein subunit POP4